MILELLKQQNLPVTNTSLRKIKEIKKEIVKAISTIRTAENTLLDFNTDDMERFAEGPDLDVLHTANTLSSIADELEKYYK